MFTQITRRSLGTAGVAYGAVIASGRAATSPKPEKLIAIVSDTYGPWIRKFSQQWTRTTGIPVEVISQAYNQTYVKIVSALAGATPVDVVIVDCIWTAAFAKAKFIRPLTAEIKPFEAQLVPVAINQRKVGGEIYSMPTTSDGKFFYYNDELLRKGGYDSPPKTWEELAGISRDLRRKGIVKYGMVWAWQQAEGLICDYTLLTAGLKGTIRDASGAWRFQEGGGLAALKFMIGQLKEGIADPASTSLNDRQIVDSFDGGSVAFMLSWSFALGFANNPAASPIAGKVKLGLIPGFSSVGTVSSSVTGGSGLGITTVSKSPAWAWDLIQFLTDKTRQVEVLTVQSNMPVWNSLYNDPEVAKTFPYIRRMSKQLDYAVWRPNLPNYAQVSSVLQRHIHEALTVQVTPEQALRSALREIKSLG
jgi:multiple sugar transport system substrate-binding protein